jgi:serine/threonine protein kinase/Tfp pilus assembly protein PilF
MNLRGLSYSVSSIAGPASSCPRCHGTSTVANGLCLACMLEEGIAQDDIDNGAELAATLDAIAVSDTHWRLGNYEILEEIGRGGMGVIYRARQRHSKRIVALKRLLSYHADSRETLARFRREAEAAASLDHPNILPIYEVGESDDNIPYFTMKYATGGSLQDAAPMLHGNARETIRLMAKVTRAVQYAHRHGILHRDLKPGNILLDSRGEPLVSDFGLAKWLDSSSNLTRTLTIFGTPGYIAPEQAEASPQLLGPTADLYSLGAILFDLLGGRPPFLGEHALAVIRQASEKPAPKLCAVFKGADKDLVTICARCLEREPNVRYQSAADLAEDLERWLEGRPILARPVSFPEAVWRWSKRNRLVAVGSLATLALFALTIEWQSEKRRVTAKLLEERSAAHSLGVIPFLDLDSGNPNQALAATVGNELRLSFAQLGPAKIEVLSSQSNHWTGSGIQDEVEEAARQSNARFILSGTIRHFQSSDRLSLHLWHGADGSPAGKWIVRRNANQPGIVGPAVIDQALIGKLYKAFEKDWREDKETADPVLQNISSRSFYLTGRDLIGRRTVVDLDRAISCFEGAIAAEPQSIVARSYLAMACMGRELLSPRAGLWEKAFQAAEQAQAMASQDPATSRGLCFLYAAIGSNRRALNYAFNALELGDSSERVFGQIGNIWKDLGNPELALRWYEKAKVSTHQPADYDALIGDCLTDLDRDKDAEDAYSAAMQYRPDQPDGWVGLCRLRLLQGNTSAARALYQAQMPAYPMSPLGKQMAARVEFWSRDFPNAEKLYRELQASFPDTNGLAGPYADLYCKSALAAIRAGMGKRVEAEALAHECIAKENQSLSRASDNPECLYRLSAARALASDTEASLTALEQAIRCGWRDHRSPVIDPRFDHVSQEPRFHKLINDLSARNNQRKSVSNKPQIAKEEAYATNRSER